MIEYALIIIKPDAKERGLEEEIYKGLCHLNLQVAKIGSIHFDINLLMDFYQWSKIDFPTEMENYMCAESLPILIAGDKNAISKTMAYKEAVRKRFFNGPLKNLFHSPVTHEESQWQYNFLKNKGAIMNNQRTRNQVEAIVFKKMESGEFLFLMLLRAPERGGFWQPVTGNVGIGESFENAALREVKEELGIKNVIRLIDTEYSYEFFDNGMDQFERIFGVEVSVGQQIQLSSEHTEYYWATKDEALNKYLKYPGNKEGLKRLHKIMTKKS